MTRLKKTTACATGAGFRGGRIFKCGAIEKHTTLKTAACAASAGFGGGSTTSNDSAIQAERAIQEKIKSVQAMMDLRASFVKAKQDTGKIDAMIAEYQSGLLCPAKRKKSEVDLTGIDDDKIDEDDDESESNKKPKAK